MPSWEQLQPILDQLAEGLGTTASNLWVILVQRQIVAGYQDLMWAGLWLFCAIVFLIGSITIYRSAPKHLTTEQRDDYYMPSAILAVIFVAMFGIAIGIVVSSAIPHLVSPEYSALQALLSMVKK